MKGQSAETPITSEPQAQGLQTHITSRQRPYWAPALTQLERKSSPGSGLTGPPGSPQLRRWAPQSLGALI